MFQSRSSAKLAGFTVVELLVVIGVVGALLAITIPAVLGGRASTRRLECKNHLHQLGIASQHYHNVYGHLPKVSGAPVYVLRPFLEAQSSFEYPPTDDAFPLFLCPDDVLQPQFGAPYSYLLCGGGCLGCGNGVIDFGSFPLRPVRFRDVTDGLSHTALFGERRASLPFDLAPDVELQCRADPVRCVWHLDSGFVPGSNEAYVQACADPNRRMGVLPAHTYDSRWHYMATNGIYYSHLLPPNQSTCYGITTVPTSHQYASTSGHVGGVNLLLCDGSVRFVNDSIDLRTWWALGTRNGNDQVGKY